MKVNKTICLDIKIIKKLEEIDNASNLINTLLIGHFGDNRSEDEIIKDVKAKIAGKKQDIKHKSELEAKLKKRIAEMKKNKKKLKFGDPRA